MIGNWIVPALWYAVNLRVHIVFGVFVLVA